MTTPEDHQMTACRWCRECGHCDYGLPMSCTCGDCTCAEDCGHPNCEAAEWADRERRAIPATFAEGSRP
jgi:hypothetical protein